MWQRNSRGFFAVVVTESYYLTIRCFPQEIWCDQPLIWSDTDLRITPPDALPLYKCNDKS